MTANKKILAIEDDEDIQELIRHNLSRDGFRVTGVLSAEAGLKAVRQEIFDCILLDLMLPGIDGLETCRQLKKNTDTQHIPVIMITAKGEEADIVAGLEIGADDYVVKPFSPRVLTARLRSVLRRHEPEPDDTPVMVKLHDIEINPGRHEVRIANHAVELSHLEFRVLHLMASRPGWVFTRSRIIDSVRDDNYQVSDRSVDVIIVGLRRKMGESGRYIETVRGVGYKFTESEQDS